MPTFSGFAPVPLPGLPRIPLLGSLPRLFQFIRDPIAMLKRLRPLGDVVAVTRDDPALVCVFGPERNREVLSNPDGFRNDETFIDGPEGSAPARIKQSIVLINGEPHKRHRKLMAPAFTRSALEGYALQTVEITQRVVDAWPLDAVVDLDARVRDVTLQMAIRNLYGIEIGSEAGQLSDLSVEWITIQSHPLSVMFRYDIPGTPYARSLRLGDQVIARLEALVAEKRAQVDLGEDVMARLVRATDEDDDRFTDEELISEAATLFVAGYETTAQTLSWTLFLLERHPRVLADLLDEIDGAIGDRTVTTADLPRMPLLERVIKESMRILPVTPTLFLRVPHDDLPLGDITMPKGANVVVSPYATHHDPALYPEPERFRPERWENEGRRSPFEYLPFGAGPRVCIGANFALLNLRLMLPTILQRVRVAVVEGAQIDRFTRANIMRPRRGIPARLLAPSRERHQPAPIRGDMHELVAMV